MKSQENQNSHIDKEIKVEFNKLLDRIDAHEEAVINKSKNRSIVNKTILSAAASLVLLFATYYYISERENTVVVAKGEEQIINLPDGSSVHMNGDSELSYKRWFTNNRKVKLSGEAFFDVVKLNGKTFTVHTNDFDIEVLGTSFNVKNYDTDRDKKVSLQTGKVRLTSLDGSKLVTLEPGQRFVYEKKNSRVLPYNINQTAQWRDGVIQFDNASVKEVIQTLNRTYNLNIKATGASFPSLFTGKFKNADAEQIIKVWTKSCHLNFNASSSEISSIEQD